MFILLFLIAVAFFGFIELLAGLTSGGGGAGMTIAVILVIIVSIFLAAVF